MLWVSKYVPSFTQAVIRGLPNAIGIDIKKNKRTNILSYLSDKDYDWFLNHFNNQINIIKELNPKYVYILINN